MMMMMQSGGGGTSLISIVREEGQLSLEVRTSDSTCVTAFRTYWNVNRDKMARRADELMDKLKLRESIAASVMVRGEADAVMSAGLFFGEDTTESFDPVDIFKNPINHATAAASFLVYSATRENFHPKEMSAESLVPAFNTFVEKVATFPGLFLEYNSHTSFSLKNHTTVEEFEQVIRDGLSSMPHGEKLAFKFAGLVPLHQEDESLKNWFLSLVVLDQPQGSHTVSTQIVYVRLSIAYEHTCTGIKAYIPEQKASISLSRFKFSAAFLSAYAEMFADTIPIVDVEHMIAYFTSPESEIDRLRVWLSERNEFQP